jgi:PAS domain S-box-containing protein
MSEQTRYITVTADDIVDTIREPLVVLDADLRVTRANRYFYQTFRTLPEDTEGKLVYDLGAGEWDVPALRQLLEETLSHSTAFDDFEVIHDFPRIGRKVMLLNARRIRREGNHMESILLAIEDITERRRIEDERRELESRFTSLVKNIRDHCIFTLDPDGQIISWNREAERIIRFGEEEVIGQHFSIIFTPEDQQAGMPAEELRLALRDGRAEDERWHARKGGERFWAMGIVTPLHDAIGRHIGFAKILRDMTDRKLAEEALREADRRKDEFLATLAHELRNPLAPIRNGLQLLRFSSDPELTEQTRAMMERQLGQLVRLVDDLLDVSRISRNKLELRKATVELWSAVQSAIETARPEIEAKGHTLTVTMSPVPVYVNADATRLAQVFWNLLNNSAKYTAAGGTIRLSAETQGSEVVVTVQDNGIGIPGGSLSGVFDIFYQVDQSLERA